MIWRQKISTDLIRSCSVIADRSGSWSVLWSSGRKHWSQIPIPCCSVGCLDSQWHVSWQKGSAWSRIGSQSCCQALRERCALGTCHLWLADSWCSQKLGGIKSSFGRKCETAGKNFVWAEEALVPLKNFQNNVARSLEPQGQVYRQFNPRTTLQICMLLFNSISQSLGRHQMHSEATCQWYCLKETPCGFHMPPDQISPNDL